MKSLSHVIVIGLLLVSISGCMSFDVENHPTGMDLTASSPPGGIETIHGSFYGFYWKTRTREDAIKCKGDISLYCVKYHTNMLYCLASVLSLGLYVPETIEWWCVAPPPKDGPLLESVPMN